MNLTTPFRIVQGKLRLQKLFEFLFKVSLKGLNFGNGGDFRQSGELNVLKLLHEKVSGPLTVFDVGANVGGYSLAVLKELGPSVVVHAFEPSRKTFEVLKKNTENASGITLNNFGVSDLESRQTLYTNSDGSKIASMYQRKLSHYGIRLDKTEDIELSTVDVYCAKNHIERINLLKLDIEGHELKALLGAARMIADKRIDMIQFEFGGTNLDSRTYFKDFYLMLRENYRIYRILSDGLYELPEYRETYEIFVAINYLAVLR